MKNAVPRKQVKTYLEPGLVDFLDKVFIPGTSYENRSDVLNELIRDLEASFKVKIEIPADLPAPIKKKLHG